MCQARQAHLVPTPDTPTPPHISLLGLRLLAIPFPARHRLRGVIRVHRSLVLVLPSPAMAASGAAVAARGLALPLVVLAVLLLAPSSSVASTRDNRTEEDAAAGGGSGGGGRACTYTLKVKTSCASPRRTSDAVSVAFGDAYRNEVHAPRLPSGSGSGSGRALERCATDTFRVAGPCGYGVCYLYLRRAGRDGWAPEWVQVVEPGPRAGAAPATDTFYFGGPLPDGVWYGHDRCPKATSSSTAAPRADSSKNSPASPHQG